MLGIVAGFLILTGAAGVAAGLRGRRINDHPICRGCRFDLTGVYPGITTCPECGRDLGPAGRVRMGARRARWWMAVAGAMLLVCGLSVGAIAASGVDATKYKPVWWIVAIDMRRDDAGRLAAAAKELRRRLDDGELAAAELRPAADRILAIQGREERAWARELGDLFEHLWTLGVLGDEQTLRYMRQTLVVSLHVEEAYEAGVVRFHAAVYPKRHGSGTSGRSIPLCVTLDWARLRTPGGGVEIKEGPHGMIFAEKYPRGGSTGIWELAAPGIPKGTYPLEATIRLRYDLGIPMTPDVGYLRHFHTATPPEQGSGPREEWTVTLTKEAQVLEEDREVYRVMVDPRLRERVRHAFSTPRLRSLGTDGAGRTHLDVQFTVSDPGVGLEHRMFLRQGLREIELREKVYWLPTRIDVEPEDTRDHYVAVTTRLEEGVPVELVLRPAPTLRAWWEVRHASPDGLVPPVWGEEIVLPVERVRAEGASGRQ